MLGSWWVHVFDRLGMGAGTVGSQPAEQLLKATIRTYKFSPKRREAAPDTVQQSVSPARTVSYSLQKASLRRSLSPNIGRQTPLRQPEWDSSKPARPSPQRAQRASADLDPAMTSVLRFNSLSSPQHAQHAAYAPEFQTCRLEEGQHAQHAASGTNQPCTSREDLTTSRSGVPQIGGSAQPVSLSQTPQSPPVGSSAAFPSASGNTIIASARSSSVPKNATRTQAGLRSCGRGQTSPTPSPPRFRRLPSNNLADRPAWASTTASRGATPSHPRGVTPLRRTTGSTTVAATPKGLTLTPPPHPATVPAPLQGAGSHQHMTDIDDRVGRRVASSDPQATTVDVTVEPGQGSSDTHADYLVDSEAHAHAQALQQLQQAVEEYNSSSPNVLVPTAVELAAALRHAAKGPAPSKPSLEALQLPALRVSHQAGDGDSPSHSVPATPWPQWVRGAWGSPQAEGRGEAEGCASGPVAGKDLAPAGAKRGKEKPQRAQRDPRAGGAEPCNNGWSPVKRPESSAGRRSALVRRALAEAEAAAGKGPASQVKPKGSSWRARAAAVRPRSSATPPRGVPRRSRVSATPPRPSTHSSGAVQQAEALQHKSKPHVSLNQAGAVVKPPSLRDGQAAASHNPTGQPNLGTLQPLKGRPLSVVRGSQPAPPRAEPPSRAGAGSVQSQQRENALQAFGLNVSAQHANVAQADRSPRHAAKFWAPEDTEQPQHSMHAEATPAASPPSSNTALHQPSHAEHVVLSNSKEQAPAGVAPLHSVTSVAALRLSFEQMGSSGVASVKPRNRLPLRKVSSKAQVHIDDGSPQQAALLWQHSLRGADIMDAVEHAEHAEHAEPDQAVQQGDLTAPRSRSVTVVVWPD